MAQQRWSERDAAVSVFDTDEGLIRRGNNNFRYTFQVHRTYLATYFVPISHNSDPTAHQGVLPTAAQKAAMTGAPSASGGNPFATIADISAGGIREPDTGSDSWVRRGDQTWQLGYTRAEAGAAFAPASHVGAVGILTHGLTSAGQAGFAPQLSGSATTYLDGSGNWSVPAGGGTVNNWINANAGTNFTTAPVASAANSLAAGDAAIASSNRALAIGHGATAGAAFDSMAVGPNSTAQPGVAVGDNVDVTGGALGFGQDINASHDATITVGKNLTSIANTAIFGTEGSGVLQLGGPTGIATIRTNNGTVSGARRLVETFQESSVGTPAGNVIFMTQTEYDGLTRRADTLYVITGA